MVERDTTYNCAAHRTGCVLTVRYRNDAAATDKSQAWLNADNAVGAQYPFISCRHVSVLEATTQATKIITAAATTTASLSLKKMAI